MVEKKSADKVDEGTDVGEKEIQAQFDEETAQGFRGARVDPTPLEHYTVDGVLNGKPTPETDENAAQRAAQVEF